MSVQITKAEMATLDLVVLVRISDLKTKDMLAAALVTFAAKARTTALDLQVLMSKILGAVDTYVNYIFYKSHIVNSIP